MRVWKWPQLHHDRGSRSNIRTLFWKHGAPLCSSALFSKSWPTNWQVIALFVTPTEALLLLMQCSLVQTPNCSLQLLTDQQNVNTSPGQKMLEGTLLHDRATAEEDELLLPFKLYWIQCKIVIHSDRQTDFYCSSFCRWKWEEQKTWVIKRK